MTILEDIANKSGMTREEIALAMGYTRQAMWEKLKKPKQMSLLDLEKFAYAVKRSPRNLFTLIINN